MTDSALMQVGPREFLARVLLAQWSYVRVGENALRDDPVSQRDVSAKYDNRIDLGGGEIGVPVIVAGIGDLDADRVRIHVLNVAPAGGARVPGPALLRHALNDAAVLEDQVVRGNLARQ